MAEDLFGIVGTVQAGAYRVDRVVAEGGFAVVYRAYHEAFRSDVALKCLKIPGALSEQHRAEFLEKFREEAQLLFQLSAAVSAVVRPLHVGTIDSPSGQFIPFIALEWLEGSTLEQLVHERGAKGLPPMPLEELVVMLEPVARALQRAHAFPSPSGTVSILHRDLKPENLFVAQIHGQRQVKVLDFGIGKVKSVATQIVGQLSADQSGLTAFTPAYGAPEQWLPKRFGQTGTWTDVWGLAVTVLEAATGTLPFEGDASEILCAATDESLRPTPRQRGVATRDEVDAVFCRALAVDPRNRYSSVGEFWDALRLALGLSDERPAAPLTDSARVDVQIRVQESREPATRAEGMTQRSATTEPRGVDSEPLVATTGPMGIMTTAEAYLQIHVSSSPPPRSSPTRSEPSLRGSGLPDLEGIGIRPGIVSSRPPVARRSEPVVAAQERRALRRLGPPMKLLLAAAGVMGADFAYVLATGTKFELGPLSAFWIAAPLAVLGLGLIVSVLVSEA